MFVRSAGGLPSGDHCFSRPFWSYVLIEGNEGHASVLLIGTDLSTMFPTVEAFFSRSFRRFSASV